MKSFGKRVRGLLGAWAMVSAIAAGVAAPSVRAETPPQQKEQVPGYFRMALGKFEVTALYAQKLEFPAQSSRTFSTRKSSKARTREGR